MRSILLAAIFLVACAAEVRADEATAWAEKAYKITASVAPGALKAGDKAMLVISIDPVDDAKVHGEAPIKVKLSGPAALKLGKEKLGRADGKMAGKSFRFEVPADAAEAGAGKVEADVDFFICSERWCVRQQARVSAPVKVCGKDQASC